jgi:hypothetical protein
MREGRSSKIQNPSIPTPESMREAIRFRQHPANADLEPPDA